MRKLKYKTITKNVMFIIVGCVFYAIGIALFLDPNGLTPAGVAGLAIVLNHFLDVYLGISNLGTGAIIALVNIPIMLLGIWKFGFKFFFSTIAATLLSSWFIDYFATFEPLTTEPLLASILGGASLSFGMGLVFKAGATTGGSDVIVRALRSTFKHIKTGEMFWILDGIVILITVAVFKEVSILLYAVITLTVSAIVIDLVLYGSDSATMVYIMSDNEKAISNRILKELEAGVTFIRAEGAYTGKPKNVLLCVIKKHMFAKIKSIVTEEDPQAFMIVTKATEIFGEGFKDHNSEDL